MARRIVQRAEGVAVILAMTWLFAGCGSSGGGSDGSAGSSTGENAEVAGGSNTVGSVTEMGRGDLLLIGFSGGKATVNFSGGAAGTEYVLIVQDAAPTAGSSNLTVAEEGAPLSGLGKALLAEDDGWGRSGPQEDWDAMLRSAESDVLDGEDEVVPPPASVVKSLTKGAAVGSRGSFRVLSSLTSVSSYSEVAATARCVNSRVALYADTAMDQRLSGVMAASDYETLCAQFKAALDTEFGILGEPPDINGDGSITVLMTPRVNALGASGGGIVTGFFFAGDLLKRSASNPAGNEREIVFVVAPDPNGAFGTTLSKDFTMNNLLTAVVPHEAQHLLSYYNHVLLNRGAAEGAWLNEGMSHLIEDLVGYGQENPSRMALYLQSPKDSPLIPSTSPDLSERGGIYLFLRFLLEQSSDGNAFLKALLQSNRTGVENLVAAFGAGNSSLDEFREFLQRWGIALAATNAGVTGDARYTYKARVKSVATGHWQGVCLICDAADGRSTTLAGPARTVYGAGQAVALRANSNAFFRLTSSPATLALSGDARQALQGILLRTK